MNPLNFMPFWVWLLFISVVFGAGVAEGIHYQKDVDKAVTVKAALQASSVVIQSQATKMAADAKTDAVKQEVDNATVTKLQAAQATAARLATANSSLRDALNSVRADALRKGTDATRLAKEASAATNALGECSGEYSAVAKEFDECSIQLTGWQTLFPDKTASSASSAEAP